MNFAAGVQAAFQTACLMVEFFSWCGKDSLSVLKQRGGKNDNYMVQKKCVCCSMRDPFGSL
jgi:hypothetical protein